MIVICNFDKDQGNKDTTYRSILRECEYLMEFFVLTPTLRKIMHEKRFENNCYEVEVVENCTHEEASTSDSL